MHYMDLDVELPGGDNFRDVTQLFADAAAAMEPGSMVMVDGFQLQDAMSAIEIGEPRLDTGMKLENDQKEPFHPLTPLLPEEVCWIIDRAFAYEIEWHSANTLSHTVFTLQYVHSLQEIDPDLLPYLLNADPQRPMELITVVLRAFVSGLLKCCDLSWRELARGSLHDASRDFPFISSFAHLSRSVFIGRGLAQRKVRSVIIGAMACPSSTGAVGQRNKVAVDYFPRLALLQLLDHHIYDRDGFRQVLDSCQQILHQISAKSPSPEPSTNSPARRAFDPYISRRLNTFLPVRVIELPSASDSWQNWGDFLGGCGEWLALSQTHEVSGWESAFHDGIRVLGSFPSTWLLQRFFYETLGLDYVDFASMWGGPSSPRLVDMERALIKTIIPYIKGMWYNPPRRRRLLADSLLEWHMIYDMFTVMVNLTDNPPPLILKIPSAALLWRLSTTREVILSGFQLELYNAVERPFAYLYASQVIEAHLSTIDDVKSVVPVDTQAGRELEFQQIFLTALQTMCMAMFSVLYQLPTTESSWTTIRESVLRRYKWAFKPEYDDYETPAVAHPELETYVREVYQMEEDVWFSPSDSFGFAQALLKDLLRNRNTGGWAERWKDDRFQLIQGLVDTCAALGHLRKRDGESVKSLNWDMGSSSSPWFPSLK
ncbi:N-alpha-acetyltransferase, non-catalitic subunit [Marasmius crinis-equi]|uniref:N-alpha-acetyltransferase, non-catalitic subunit n=1 Tax=Marasmius crinis-equi TaxID=585013 RepID=A0ABR3EKU3_9AGAR